MNFLSRLVLRGRCDRLTYFLVGIVFFGIKFTIDRWLRRLYLPDQPALMPWDYFGPQFQQELLNTSPSTPLLVLSLIFAWIGISHSLLRLKDTGIPYGLIFLFFLPGLNLVLFALLSALPTATREEEGKPAFLARWLPQSDLGAAVFAVLLPCVVFLSLTVVATNILKAYGGSIFLGIPFTSGFCTVLLSAHHRPPTIKRALALSWCATLVLGCGLLLFAIEGLICVLMAAPIALVFNTIGAISALILLRCHTIAASSGINAVGLLALVITAEHRASLTPPVYETSTAIDIAAPREVVWQHVVQFSDITAPPEPIFAAGIAYPIRARIDGQGVGAVRYCEFSTGAFVEPISVWQPPTELRFSVISTPPPMQEWSPWRNIEPAHLQGYFLSKGGRFFLENVGEGETRVTATTWHQHRIWPASYWRVWADMLIHRIHLRVLRHIQNEVLRSLVERSVMNKNDSY